MIHLQYFDFNSFMERGSVVWDENGLCSFVDPGADLAGELKQLTELVSSKGLKPVSIMLTHAHFDHIYGVAHLVKTYDIPVYLHKDEDFTLQTVNPFLCGTFGMKFPEDFSSAIRYVKEGDIIETGSLRFEVLETPGHSKGGVCFLEREQRLLFSGDTLFAGSIGRTDHPGGDYDLMMKNIFEKLLLLEGDTRVIPGHGPETDISTERMTNPFLLPFNEPYDE